MALQTQHAVDEVPSPESVRVIPVVPQRSARRANARRASQRRATARERKDDIEARVVECLGDHPQSTTGEMAKRLNADLGRIAANVSHMVRAGVITSFGGEAAILRAP